MPLHELLLPVLGLITGFVLGTLGSGGSALALPAFVYAAGLPVKSAVATSLAVVGATSLVGAILAKRRCHTHGCPGQEVDIRVALLFAVGGIAGSYGGARLASHISDRSQMLLFACVIAGAATAMFRRKREESGGVPCEKTCAEWVIPFLGLGIGVLTGVVGVGGGFLFVPALTLLAGIPMKRAASTSLWIIAANSATGVVGYLGHTPIAWSAAAVFLSMSILGVLAGQHICRTAKPQGLQTAFAVFLLLVGTYTVARTLLIKKGVPGESAGSAVAPTPRTGNR